MRLRRGMCAALAFEQLSNNVVGRKEHRAHFPVDRPSSGKRCFLVQHAVRARVGGGAELKVVPALSLGTRKAAFNELPFLHLAYQFSAAAYL